jgi:hypothetical protein
MDDSIKSWATTPSCSNHVNSDRLIISWSHLCSINLGPSSSWHQAFLWQQLWEIQVGGRPFLLWRAPVHSGRTYTPPGLVSSSWFSSCWTFWVQQNIGTHFTRFLVAPNVEGCQRICVILWHLLQVKEPLTLSVWTSTTTANSKTTLVFCFHGLHHRFAIFKELWCNICNRRSIDKDGAFCPLHKDYHWWGHCKTLCG